MSTQQKELDPYKAKAEDHSSTPQVKIDDLKDIVKKAGVAMLTTREASTGRLHSRAMTPVVPKDRDPGLHFYFVYNNATHKDEEISSDHNVNVSFYEKSNTDWVSISGLAKITQDRDLVEKCWSPTISAFFGDLGDGVHKGNSSDPRISIIEVIPDEIRYWIHTKGTIGRAANIATAAVTGKGAAPGEIRTITNEEIQLVEGLHKH